MGHWTKSFNSWVKRGKGCSQRPMLNLELTQHLLDQVMMANWWPTFIWITFMLFYVVTLICLCQLCLEYRQRLNPTNVTTLTPMKHFILLIKLSILEWPIHTPSQVFLIAYHNTPFPYLDQLTLTIGIEALLENFAESVSSCEAIEVPFKWRWGHSYYHD